MIKTVEELKALIIWAKSQKLSRIKIGDIEVDISAYALVEEPISNPRPALDASPDLKPSSEEELLYWSTR
jgi:hypothetical protein